MRYVTRSFSFALLLLVCLACCAARVTAQNTAQSNTAAGATPELDEVRRQLRTQQAEIDRLREMVVEQAKLIAEMHAHVVAASPTADTAQASGISTAHTRPTPVASGSTSAKAQSAQSSHDLADGDLLTARVGKLEAEVRRTNESIAKRFGSVSISGDIRLRYESILGQLNIAPNAANPNVLGNRLAARNRGRLRARLVVQGQLDKQFAWSLRLVTGNLADSISTNATFTDFFTRKPFALDAAFITYTPRQIHGLRLQGGKFDVPWTHTEMTLDNDLQVEGINELYTRDLKRTALKNITLIAWQLPFLERNTAFIRNANGTVNFDESNNQSRDLALYGAQARLRLEPIKQVALTLSAANLYFSGTQFITPVQFFGGNVQLPVTLTIPATQTAPAQTLTSQVTIPRDLLVSGNANLGISTATNNALNVNGRLASGFNLVDLITRLDITKSKRFPLALIFNSVTNTQARDVISDVSDASVVLVNNERNGYWAEVQLGSDRARGDLLFGYTFMRIEKDAVLTPFNFSEIAQQSDVRAQRFNIAYAVNPHVVLALTGTVTERPNGLRGVFGATPAGSLNRPTTRLQFDTLLRF